MKHSPPPVVRRAALFHTGTIALLLLAAQSVQATPAPLSDVQWGDSGPDWVDLFVRDGGSGNPLPYTTYSLFRIGESNLYEIHTSRWTGTEWAEHTVLDELTDPPEAVTGWIPRTPPAHHEIVYLYYEDENMRWRRWDATDHDWEAARETFGPSPGGERGSLAIRSDEFPAAAWLSEIDEVVGTAYSFWDNGGQEAPFIIPTCSGGWPSLALFGDNRMRLTCLDKIANDHFDVNYVYDDEGLEFENVFGNENGGMGDEVDDHQWMLPAMAIFHNEPVVVAHDVDTAETVLRIRVSTGWLSRIVLAEGLAPSHLAIAADDGGSLGDGTLAITITTGLGVFYTEVVLDGYAATQGPLRRLDHNPDTGTACETPLTASDLEFYGHNHIVASWIVHTDQELPDHNAIHVNRLTQFRRADTTDWSLDLDIDTPFTTSLALDADGDGWTCFFNESEDAAPEIDLMLRYRDEAPLRVAVDTGAPTDDPARNCDVAVAPDGRVGVLWADQGLGVLRYREWDDGFDAAETVTDDTVTMPANGHLGLTFNGDSEAWIVFVRSTSGANNPWIARRSSTEWEDFEEIDTLVGGYYPDLVVVDGVAKPVCSYQLTSGNRVTTTRWTGASWSYRDHRVGKVCFDTSISAREVGGELIVATGWFNATDGQVEFETATDWTWGGVVVLDDEEGAGEYVAVEVDAFGEVMATYMRNPSGTDLLRLARFGRFSGGRELPDPPESRHVLCDLRPGNLGTDLELDAYDNPRILHRTSPSAFADHDFQYVSRP